jgi:hypothetical protein
MKIIHCEEWWFDSMPYVTTKTPPTSVALCQGGTRVCMPCWYHALSRSLNKHPEQGKSWSSAFANHKTLINMVKIFVYVLTYYYLTTRSSITLHCTAPHLPTLLLGSAAVVLCFLQKHDHSVSLTGSSVYLCVYVMNMKHTLINAIFAMESP